jgi:peptidyl-tRNA hydrolase, PTH2 family
MAVKQVILVRRVYPDGKGGTFKPRWGKLMAQVAHASMKVFFDRAKFFGPNRVVINGLSERNIEPCMMASLTPEMREWAEGLFTKIVLTVDSEENLLLALKMAEEAGLPCALITDAGLTEFNGKPTNTCIAIGPAKAADIDKITGPDPIGAIKTRLP